MQIPFDQLAPFCLLLFGYLRVSIPGKIHQIQFFIDIVKIDGLELLDGGISDSIPIKKFREMGYEKNILILTQHNGYRKTKSSIIPLLKMKMGKKYPNLIHDMEIRHNEYNKTLDYIKELEKEGSVYVIRPKNPITIKRTERDPNKLRLLYNVGYKEGLEHIEAMKKFLNQ